MADSHSRRHDSKSRSSSKHRDRDRDNSRKDRERERDRDREHSHLRRHESERRSHENHHRSDSRRISPHRSRTTDEYEFVRSPKRSERSMPPPSRRSRDDKDRDRDRDRGYTSSRHDDRGRSDHKGTGGPSRHQSVPTGRKRVPVMRTVSVWTNQSWASPDVAFDRWDREREEKKRMKEGYQQQLLKKVLKKDVGREQSSASILTGSSSKPESVAERVKAFLGIRMGRP